MVPNMKMKSEREMIVEHCKKLVTSGLTTGTGGNISICDRAKGLMAISPSGMDYFETQPEDVVVMDLSGNIVEGSRKPSVEHSMHTIFYTNRDDVNAVVHTHSTSASTMAALHWSLPAVNYLVALVGGTEVPCARYEIFSTPELAKATLEGMGKCFGAFMANHGFIAAAPDLPRAFNIAEEIERCSTIYLKAKAAGEPKIIPDEKIFEMFEMAKKKKYGQ